MTTLVTGATGFLGGHAVHGLLERGERVLALVRAKDDQEARARLWTALELHLSHEGVEGPRRLAGWLSTAALLPVRGDIREPGLGLSGQDAARVLADVDRVVHAAASLNRRSNTACVDVNLRGGLEVVRLSRRLADAGRLRRHLHVSTVAVAGKRRGEVVQEDQAVEWDRPDWDPYARTKKFGEHLVRTLLHDAPAVVVRPSIVMGDSRWPETTQFDMVRAFVRLAQSPVLPFRPDARLDIVPVDFVGAAIVQLALAASTKHATYHLAAGAASPTFRDVTDALAKADGARGPRYAPRLVGPVGSAVHWLANAGRHPVQRIAALLDVFWPYLDWDVVFDNRRVVEETGLVPAPFTGYCAGLRDFAVRTNFAYPHRPAPAEVLAAAPAAAVPAATP